MILIPCLVILALFSGCSDDSSPSDPQDLTSSSLTYFPLSEDYKAEYEFTCESHSRDTSGPYQIEHEYTGAFRLEVVDTHVRESSGEMFYKLRTTLSVQREYYKKQNLSAQTDPLNEEYTKNDYVLTDQYNIMLHNDSLWYVDGAPSFERLDLGQARMMMAWPVANGGAMDLELFNCLEMIHLESLPFTVSKTGNICGYSWVQIDILSKSLFIETVKGRGIRYIFYQEELGVGAVAAANQATFKFELAE